MRIFWIILAVAFLAAGVIGLVLPVMPTVPFVVLSAYCAAKGSPKLYNWLINNKTFGPMILDWQQRGAIARKTKWITTISLFFAIVLAFLLKLHPLLILIEAGIFIVILIFVWTRPE